MSAQISNEIIVDAGEGKGYVLDRSLIVAGLWREYAAAVGEVQRSLNTPPRGATPRESAQRYIVELQQSLDRLSSVGSQLTALGEEAP